MPDTPTKFPWWRSEDWLALAAGLLLFTIALLGLAGVEIFGWVVKTNVWTSPSQIMTPASRSMGIPGAVSLIGTYLFLLVVLLCCVKPLGAHPGRFAKGFTLLFFLSYACYAAGHYAQIAATPDQLKKFGIPWSLNLTGEARRWTTAIKSTSKIKSMKLRDGVVHPADSAVMV